MPERGGGARVPRADPHAVILVLHLQSSDAMGVVKRWPEEPLLAH